MKRAEITARLPFVLGLDRLEAAASVGVSATLFDALVDAGVMPQPRIIRKRRPGRLSNLKKVK